MRDASSAHGPGVIPSSKSEVSASSLSDSTSGDVLSQDDIDSASDKIDVATSSGNVTLMMTLDLGAADR
jgi:hypothetical protein